MKQESKKWIGKWSMFQLQRKMGDVNAHVVRERIAEMGLVITGSGSAIVIAEPKPKKPTPSKKPKKGDQ